MQCVQIMSEDTSFISAYDILFITRGLSSIGQMGTKFFHCKFVTVMASFILNNPETVVVPYTSLQNNKFHIDWNLGIYSNLKTGREDCTHVLNSINYAMNDIMVLRFLY